MELNTNSNTNTNFNNMIDERLRGYQKLIDHSCFEFKIYQAKGIEWCIRRELTATPFAGVRGGIIADEMGLGKTMMMIGTMFCNYLPHTLIVLPPILLPQWQKEIYKISGHKALCFYGANKGKVTLEQLTKAPIILTSYNTLLNKECLLVKIQWDRVIFDEAHHMRNSKTQRFASCRQIDAKIRWMVTGTPIQNKRQDFFSLCDLLGLNSAFYKNKENMDRIRAYFVLRRTKQQVGIELPEMRQTKVMVEWSNLKEKMLAEELHSLLPNQTGVSYEKRKQLAAYLEPKGILTAMLRARQSCILPSMMKGKMFNGGGGYDTALNCCSKLDAVLLLLIDRRDNGRGKIVFCHFKDEMDLIKLRLTEAGYKKVVCCDGRTPKSVKKTIADEADALIIQIQTGCEGLNLQQHFSEVYFVSPHWNPAVEAQAVARCHRIGQKSEVDVFKFEMNGFDDESITLEKYVSCVQENKKGNYVPL